MYYIDNVSVDVTPSKIQKKVLASHFWKFSDESFDGLKLMANGTESEVTGIQDGSKTIDGEKFTKKFRLDKTGTATNKALMFTVPAGTTDVTIYAASANSSQTRTLHIYDSKTDQSISVLSATTLNYTFENDTDTAITLYADTQIDVFGISYETYEYVTTE